MIDLEHIRKNIILKKDNLYFDYTASGLAYKPIEKSISKMLLTYANTHSQGSKNATITHELYETSRQSLKDNLELDSSFFIFPCGYGSSAAIKKFQEILGLYLPPQTKIRLNIEKDKNLPLVLIGPYEHHSNEISFRESICEVKRIKLNKNNELDFKDLEETLKKNNNREIIASFSVSSNVTGVITDYKKLYRTIKKYNGILALDAASYSPYFNVDCKYYDALFLSPHKLLGGIGSCGLLVLKKNLYKSKKPTFAGGGTVNYVSRTSHEFVKDPEELEQGGTPAIIQLIKASLAYKLRNEIGFRTIKDNEKALSEYFERKIFEIDNIIMYSPKNIKKIPVFSFNIKNYSPYDLANILSTKFQIQARAGCSCAGPYGHDILGLKDNQGFKQKPGWLRVGLHYTHNFNEIDYLISCIKKIISK